MTQKARHIELPNTVNYNHFMKFANLYNKMIKFENADSLLFFYIMPSANTATSVGGAIGINQLVFRTRHAGLKPYSDELKTIHRMLLDFMNKKKTGFTQSDMLYLNKLHKALSKQLRLKK